MYTLYRGSDLGVIHPCAGSLISDVNIILEGGIGLEISQISHLQNNVISTFSLAATKRLVTK